MDVNVNAAECIKQVTGIGTTTYTNICNGTSQVVSWGAGDWIGNIAIFGTVLFCFLFGKLFMEGM